MGIGSAGSHKKIQLRKKRILKIGLLEHDIQQIKVQKLLTFLFNYKIRREFQNILLDDQNSKLNSGNYGLKKIKVNSNR